MSGPEHYQAAEKLLDAADAGLTTPSGHEYANTLIAEAQVHATLALTAATLDATSDRGLTNAAEWARAGA